MRIVYLANIRFPTEKAHGIQIMKTCEALADAGHDVVLCLPYRRGSTDDDPFEYYGVKRNFKIKNLPSFDFIWLKPARLGFILSGMSFALAVSLIRMNESDIVYSRDEYSLWLLSFYKKFLYFEAHDGRFNFFMRRVLTKCTGIIAITRGLADFYVKNGVSESKIKVIPDAVELSQFRTFGSDFDLKTALKLPKTAKIATYSGSLSVYSWKGVDVFLESLKHISNLDLYYMVVGGNPADISHLRSKFDDKRIIFIGRVPPKEVSKYLLGSDVLILPNRSGNEISEKFTSPMKLFEYMAAGKPIIASDLPSMREVLNESNAILVRPDDSKSLAAGITTVLNDNSIAGRISQNSLNDVEEYSWQKRAVRITSFIRGEATEKSPVKIKDQAFYDNESIKYSEKRYPKKDTDYTHFFFKRRLAIAMSIVRQIVMRGGRPSLLEVGCADGIVLRKMYEEFGTLISSYQGIDTSPGMIETARIKQKDLPISFNVRDPNECFGDAKSEIILEIGVLNYADFDKDIVCAKQTLAPNGYYVCALAARGSFWDLHRKSESGFNNFYSYGEYEKRLREHFTIISMTAVGVFVPGIWRVPAIARPLQWLAETILSKATPNLCHEKVYVLKAKS